MSYKKSYEYKERKLVLKVSVDADEDGKAGFEVEVKLDPAEVVDEVLRVVKNDPQLADKVSSYVPHFEAVVQALRVIK